MSPTSALASAPAPTSARHRMTRTLTYVAAAAAAAAAVTACRDPVAKCDASVDYFPDKVAISRAKETIKDVNYGGAYMDMTVAPKAGSDTEFRYRFVRCGCEAEADGRTVVQVPVEGAYVGDTIIMAMLNDELEAGEFVRSVGTVEYAYSAEVRQKVASGTWGNATVLGEGMEGVDVGIVGEFQVDAFRKAELGVPMVVVAETSENDPLGRAEWVKVMGVLTGKEKEATAKWEQIRFRYEDVEKERAFTSRRRPSVVLNKATSSLGSVGWSQPGGETYMAAFLKDANVDYRFAEDVSASPKKMSIAQVGAKFASARYWINAAGFPGTADEKLDDFVGDEELPEAKAMMKKMASVRCGNVWSQNKEVTVDGKASNFYEEAVLRPDLVLSDMLTIFHPELDTADTTKLKFYYHLGDPSAGTADPCPYNALTVNAPDGKDFHVAELRVVGVDRFEAEDRLYAGAIVTEVASAANVPLRDVEIFFNRQLEEGDDGVFMSIRHVIVDGDRVDTDAIVAAVQKSIPGSEVTLQSSETSNTSLPDKDDEDENDGGIGGGGIAGIAIALAALVGLLIAAFVCLKKKRVAADDAAYAGDKPLKVDTYANEVDV